MIGFGSNIQSRFSCTPSRYTDHVQVGVNTLIVGLLLAECAVAGLILLAVAYMSAP